MKIYISGITGTAMGALAIMAKEAGLKVCGSDLSAGAVMPELLENKIEVKIGKQDGKFLREKIEAGEVGWFVYTSALAQDHAELRLAREMGIRVSKRDELILAITKQLRLKMVAVAGTHGKTTTTAMIIWACQKLGIPVSHLVGSTLPYANAGHYAIGSKFIIYEADEYDRNFLNFHPWLSVITVVDYDHPDIYPTEEDYKMAFAQFIRQSERTIADVKIDRRIKLAGKLRRKDASFAATAVSAIAKTARKNIDEEKIISVLNDFPGAGRRFEQIYDGVYTDYAHHPVEIKATLEMAQEEAINREKKGVVVIYEPHQNTRQHEIFPMYKKIFSKIHKVFWLPTFLTRENPELLVLRPKDFVESLEDSDGETAEMNKELEKKLKSYQKDGYLILLMTAGPADGWLRKIKWGE